MSGRGSTPAWPTRARRPAARSSGRTRPGCTGSSHRDPDRVRVDGVEIDGVYNRARTWADRRRDAQMFKAAVAFVLVVAGAAGTVPSTASAGSKAAVDTKSILKYGTDLQQTDSGAGPTLDPALMKGDPRQNTWGNLVYDNLVRVAPDGRYVPGLATSWTFPDDKTIELSLRKITFQDRTPFNGDAVKFSFERTLRGGNVSNRDFLQLDTVEVVNDNTVRIHLKTAIVAAFLAQLHNYTTFVVSPTAVEKEGADFGKHPVGAGPYELRELVPDERLSVRKVKNYWDKRGWKLPGVDFVQLSQGPQEVNAIRSGQIDTFAGAAGATFDLMTYPAPAFQQVVPAVQEQLKKVGLNARIVQTTNIAQDLYIAKKAPSNILSTINPGVAKLNNLTPKFLTNYCGYDRPDVTAAIETLKSSPDPAKQK